jgi:hypothetical protein
MYIECRHIFPSGKKCQSPALTSSDFCYFHHNKRNQKSPSRKSGEPSTLVQLLPQLEDADTILTALSDVIIALAANRIDAHRARILIYGLQVASQHSRRIGQNSSIQTVRETYQDEDGSLVGPRLQRYDSEDLTDDDDDVDEEDEAAAIEERWNRELDEQYGSLLNAPEEPMTNTTNASASEPEATGHLPQIQAAAEPRGATRQRCRAKRRDPESSARLNRAGKCHVQGAGREPRSVKIQSGKCEKSNRTQAETFFDSAISI